MSNVRFIADTHFGHEKLIRNLRNMEPDDHDQLIIDNWNRVVTKKDITYVLGDFVFEKPDLIEKYLLQLNGEIRIIGGNHDDLSCKKLERQARQVLADRRKNGTPPISEDYNYKK